MQRPQYQVKKAWLNNVAVQCYGFHLSQNIMDFINLNEAGKEKGLTYSRIGSLDRCNEQILYS